MQPLVTCVKNQSLHLLSCIDDQLCLIGHEVEKRAPGISAIVYRAQDLHVLSWKVTNRLRRQGVAHAVSDMLVDYEVLVKTKSDKALNLVNKVLSLWIFVPIVCIIGHFLALAGSTWLLRHSTVRDKDLLVCEENASVLQIYKLDTDVEEKRMIGDEVAKNESSMGAGKHDEQAMNEDAVVETPRHPLDKSHEDSTDEHPECDVHNHGDLQDEIMEDQSPGKECNTKDPHIQSARQMPTDCSKSLLNDDSDESDEVINLFLSGWSFNPAFGVKK
jgi:hypothetical protein